MTSSGELLEGSNAIDHSDLYQNYQTLVDFLGLTIPEDPPEEEEWTANVSHPLSYDLLKLRKAGEHLGKKQYALTGTVLKSLQSEHPFIEYRKWGTYLRYLYFTQNYNQFVTEFQKNEDDSLELQLLYLNSLLKSGQKEHAFTLFRNMFSHRSLKPFQSHLSRNTLNEFLKKLDYDYWFDKFKFLASRGQFTEFRREKVYIKSPQLINLFYAEFYYRQKQYRLCKRHLQKVESPKLETYKLRMVLKMQVRDQEYQNLYAILEQVQPDAHSYIELLLDCASLMLIDGRRDTALDLFQRYVQAVQWNYFQEYLQWWEPTPMLHGNYWKALWRCAWLHFNNGNKEAAIHYFKQGIDASWDSYKIANRYWLKRLANGEAKKLGVDIDNYPFSYYYTLANREYPVAHENLTPFVQLLNQPRSAKMGEILSHLKMILSYGLVKESFSFIQWNLNNRELTSADRHTLMLLESMIHLNRGNQAMAFIRFRENVDCYRCLRVPRFLQDLVLPVKYADIIEQYCADHNLDPTLVFSLIREESYFRKDAASYANAYGLMQLLLKTARQMAYKDGRRKVYRRDLFKPEINIRYGTQYLRFLLDKYDNKLYLALAAYNAGDHRVDEWLTRFGELPEDQFIEMIPFSATRSYVKNILRNYYYYKYYYGANQNNG